LGYPSVTGLLWFSEEPFRKNRGVIQCEDTRRPVVYRDQQTRRLKKRVDKKNDDASKRWVSDQAGGVGRRKNAEVFIRNIPVHSAVHDLFPNPDRVVLAIDFGQRWDTSYSLPEKAVSHRQDV